MAGASDHQRLTRCEGDRGGQRSPSSYWTRLTPLPVSLSSREEASCVVTNTHLGPHGLCPKSCPTTSPVALGKCLTLLRLLFSHLQRGHESTSEHRLEDKTRQSTQPLAGPLAHSTGCHQDRRGHPSATHLTSPAPSHSSSLRRRI